MTAILHNFIAVLRNNSYIFRLFHLPHQKKSNVSEFLKENKVGKKWLEVNTERHTLGASEQAFPPFLFHIYFIINSFWRIRNLHEFNS